MAKEYIEREALIERISKLGVAGAFTEAFKNDVLEIISKEPAADVQEVRHGENITSMHPTDEFICSECGIVFHDVSEYIVEDDVYREFYFDYCPKCGAKMDKEYGKK